MSNHQQVLSLLEDLGHVGTAAVTIAILQVMPRPLLLATVACGKDEFEHQGRLKIVGHGFHQRDYHKIYEGLRQASGCRDAQDAKATFEREFGHLVNPRPAEFLPSGTSLQIGKVH